jgi:hypothetical protein
VKARQLLLPVLLLALDVVLPLGGAWKLAVIFWVVHGGGYGWSLARRPILPCWACDGLGIVGGGRIWPWGRGLCWRCGGAKGFVRLGVRVLQPARAKRLASQIGLAGFDDTRRRRLIP